MGSLNDLMEMIPGMGQQMKNVQVDEKELAKMEAMILSMTPAERQNPDLINVARKNVSQPVRVMRWQQSTDSSNNLSNPKK